MQVKKKVNRVFSFVFALLISFGQVFPGFSNVVYAADGEPWTTTSVVIDKQDSWRS